MAAFAGTLSLTCRSANPIQTPFAFVTALEIPDCGPALVVQSDSLG